MRQAGYSSVHTFTLRCTAPVLSLDQKSEIQASGRIRTRLPMKKDRAGNMTPDYVRQGTTTLLPAFIGSTARYLDDYSGSSRPLVETTDPNGISEKIIRRHHALASNPRSSVNHHAAPPPEAYFPVPADAGSTIIKPAISGFSVSRKEFSP